MSPRAAAMLALAAYGCLSLALFGRSSLGDIQHVVEGFGQARAFYGRDQGIYVWSLAWAARSVSNPASLLFSNYLFAPAGYDLAWATSLPGPALLVAPATLLIGAVASYDLLALAAPAMAAWSAFLLCRHVTRSARASFAGGLLFGFGTYESVEMVNHVNLALVALVPLAALLVLRRSEGLMSRGRFILALGVVLALQLLTDSEVLASMVIFAAVAFSIAALLGGRARRARIAATAAESLGAAALAAVLAGPYIYYLLRYPNPVGGLNSIESGADIANLVIPNEVTWLHSIGGSGAAADLRPNISEQLAYLGVPLLAVLCCFAVEARRSALGRCLVAFMLVAVVASLGGHAVLADNALGVALPWSAVGQLPLLSLAIPARFSLYVWLAAAVALAWWLARRSHVVARWAAFALIAVSLAPNAAGVPWGTRFDAPALLAPRGELARYVGKGATVLALPFGIWGESMFWQFEADFRFRLAGGYLSIALPPAYRPYAEVIRGLDGEAIVAPGTGELCAFLRFTGATVVLVRDGAPPASLAILDRLGLRSAHSGGFTIYQVTPSASSAARRACV